MSAPARETPDRRGQGSETSLGDQSEPPTALQQMPQPDEKKVLSELEQLRIRAEAKRRHRIEQRPETYDPDVRTLADELAHPRPEPEFVIPGLLPHGGKGLAVAQAKVGKTTLRNYLARCLLDGGEFMGQHVDPIDGGLLLADLEMSPAQSVRWLARQGVRGADRLHIAHLTGNAGAFDLTNEDTYQRWLEYGRTHSIKAALIDAAKPLLSAAGLDGQTDTAPMTLALSRLTAELQLVALVLFHHMGWSAERSMGDTNLVAWPDAIWHLVLGTPGDHTSPRYFSAHGRDVNYPEKQYSLDEASGTLSIVGGDRRTGKAHAALDDILDLLANADQAMSGRAIAGALATTNHTRESIRAAIRIGISDGRIDRTSGRHNSHLHALSALVRRSAPSVRQRSGEVCASAPIDGAQRTHADADQNVHGLGALEVTEQQAFDNLSELLDDELVEGGDQ